MAAGGVRRNWARTVACLSFVVGGACGGSTASTAVPPYDRDAGARIDAEGQGAEASVDDASGAVDEANPAAIDATAAIQTDGGASSADSASAGVADAIADAKGALRAADAARCGADSCPSGCCDDQGFCRPGTEPLQCGSEGAACQRCLPPTAMAGGGPVIAGCIDQQCAMPPATSPCATGCAGALGQCPAGTTDTACGLEGEPCVDCTSMGLTCLRQQCVFWGTDGGVCNGQTCSTGCCDWNGTCQQGLTGTVCGNFGAGCVDCEATGEACSHQQCVPPVGPAACDTTCAGCCDAAGHCQPGNTNTQCGGMFRSCRDCSAIGATCDNGTCAAPDGGTTCFDMCDGCCDTLGNCHFGLVDTQCGSAGSLCQDCTHRNPPSTCDLSSGACLNGEACPVAYAGCPDALTVAAPAIEHVCTSSDLANAAAACADELTCIDFQQMVGGPCETCLESFAFGIPTLTTAPGQVTIYPPMQAGIRACAAPFVDATCNHNSACMVDCLTEACGYTCSQATQCASQAQAGTCAGYFAADACMTQALAGPAAFCDLATYQGNFGAWLQAVGAHYCAQ